MPLLCKHRWWYPKVPGICTYKNFMLNPNFHSLLQSSHLGHRYSVHSILSMIWSLFVSAGVSMSSTSYDSALVSLVVSKHWLCIFHEKEWKLIIHHKATNQPAKKSKLCLAYSKLESEAGEGNLMSITLILCLHSLSLVLSHCLCFFFFFHHFFRAFQLEVLARLKSSSPLIFLFWTFNFFSFIVQLHTC